MARSLTTALRLVAELIQSSFLIRLSYTSNKSLTSASIARLEAAGKYRLAYCSPSASPTIPVLPSARRQSARIFFCPVRTAAYLKFSLIKRPESKEETSLITCHSRYAFHSSSETVFIILLTALKNSGWPTMSVLILGACVRAKYADQSMFGESFCSCASVIL